MSEHSDNAVENIMNSIMDTIADNLPNKKSVRFDEGGSVSKQTQRLFDDGRGDGKRNPPLPALLLLSPPFLRIRPAQGVAQQQQTPPTGRLPAQASAACRSPCAVASSSHSCAQPRCLSFMAGKG
ncbi:hypothetical protein PR202_ga22836 [Eleusine coracana subsp. coracana]|uniref:Uncharacterized protein n=1 Tax=Eleusine coracana subsp. coracana TaxID=191504 RepID=A0AAV5D494_ELECO|nr:hypothetical protein PR202_ga22836 [Eleusine coracana subsp. coracana]